MKTGWWKIVLFAGLLVVASVSAGLGKEPWEVGTQDGSGIWVGFSMTPQVPHLGETAEVVGKVVAAACDVPEAEIFFGDGKGNLIGVELVNCKQRFTTSLKRGVPKEFRFKIKFVGSPAEVQVYANARYYRESDGSIIPDRIHGVAGYGLVMNKKTKEFRMPDLMKDPYSDLQEELGLPQGGYWYSVTVSLSFDIKEYAKQRKQSEEEVINLLKAKAVALAKQRKIKKEEAYRVISKERLLWKDAGLPDPFYRSLEQQQKDSRLKLQKNPSSKVATRLSGYWYYDDHHYDWQTSLQKSLGDTFTPSALIILVLALILGILFSASKAFNPFRIKEEQAMKTGWRRVVALLGLLLVVGMGISMADVRTLHMGVTIDPVNPRLDEVTEITVKVWEGTYPEVPKLEINLSNSRGIELLDVSPKTVLALRGKEAKECRFRVKYISSPAEFIVTAMYKKIRYTNGRLIDIQDDPRDPSWGLANGEGEVLYMYEKDKRFYSQSALQSLLHPDPAVVLQQELSLPDVGNEKSYWYAIALHLNGDIEDFSKAKKLSREAVIKLLKDKAEVLAKNEKITKEKAYETILRRRLLWKDAGLPDPHNIKNRPDLLKDQGSLRSPPVKGYTGVDGWWFYDDHKYDLQNGLQVSLSDTFTPIRYCKFEVTDIGCDSYPRSETLDASGYTGEDGSFSSSFILPHGEQIYHIFIKCYAKGPSDLNPRINVLDSTNQTYYCTIPTSVVSNHAGSYKLHVPRYDSQNYPQPRSGAWNIYDILYRGFKKTYASTLLHVWWDPNKFRLTGFVPDTLWVNGSDYSYYHPDVWNDDVLLHEYGHYVYNNWTNYIEGGGATWYLAKPDFPNRAFIEGWGDFFSGVVRDSLPDTLRGRSWGPNDSLIVQTRGHIGAGQDSLDYVCLENPWHFSWFGFRDSSAFEGGPYCRGAVAGALYDIMDRYGENPYPSHPYPGWPDTIPLADTLRIRVSPFAPLQSPYFNIMKNWRSGWLSGNHGVLTIYDFLSGWCYPPDPSRQGYILSSYGHERVIKDILTHHRIKWEKPPAPFNVRAFWDGVKFVIRLYWVMNWPPLGPQPSNPRCFNVYRAVGTPPLSYQKLNSVMDTLFVDSTATGGTAYRYFVTAVDTLGVESDTSQTVAVITGPSSGDPLATAYNNAPKILRDRQRVLHVGYTNRDTCFYTTSMDSGASWSVPVKLGPGRYPGLTLDGRDSLYAVWTKPPGPAPDTEAQILYSRRHGPGIWDPPVPLARYTMPGADLYGLSPAALVVQNDTARVVYECYNGTRIVLGPMYNWFYSIFHGTFSISAPQSVRWQLLDSLHAVVPPHILGITSPSVAADFNHLSHVVWHRLGKVCYREQIGDTLWKPLVDLSQSADWTSWHPSLNLSGNRLGVAWVLESETLLVDVIPPSAICYRSRLLGDTIWSVRETLSVGLQYSTRPVLSEGPSAAFSASPTGGGPSEVYLNNRGTSGWTAPENVSNTPLGSNFPHLFTVQGSSERVMDFLWTEGDAAPYEVVYRELSRPIPPRPWYEADVGQANSSLFTVQRDGFLVYGPLPYQTIDYDHQKLIYRFPGLDTLADYRLLLVAYFEKQVQRDNDADRIASASPASDLASPVPDGIALESSKPKIEQIVLLNGVEVGRMELVPGVPDTFSFVIPKALYQGGEVQLTLDKKKGRFASLSELYLYRWGAWGKKGAPSQGASQGGEGVTLLPKVYDLSQSYPNPAQEGLRINYALPKESQVSLKVYNVMGQMVRSLREGKEKPGFYSAEWNGKDQWGHRVASGVYLYRMEAGSFAKTRKLVVVR